MASTSSSPSKGVTTLKIDEQTRDNQPNQPQLEDDDEFEEFEVQDWDASQTVSGSVKTSGDNLWEDNWDDDDIEDDFSVQLRNELAKTGQGVTGIAGAKTKRDEPMQH